MQVTLTNIGKRFNREWIFRSLSHEFADKSCTAITGPNGSGKSTLLKIISSFQSPTNGQVGFKQPNDQAILEEELPLKINFVAPYQELIEEFTLREHLNFHFSFKTPVINQQEMMVRARLVDAQDKYVAEFSSGMKQRLRLMLAFFSTSGLILLDEPTSNLDEQGIAWFQEELAQIISKNTIIIASNQRYEYELATDRINLSDFKPAEK
ncbi:MAG: ATP-binding cassette domain-containing protein [Cyclobacteriaceae bacterium]|nr:ATP-binding cassette domain-containing protein [Cyclobacteriaceae bacterium HetDA_MAG_MS6]